MDLIELLDEPGIAFADQPQVDRGCAAVGRDAVQRLADDQVHDDVRLVASPPPVSSITPTPSTLQSATALVCSINCFCVGRYSLNS